MRGLLSVDVPGKCLALRPPLRRGAGFVNSGLRDDSDRHPHTRHINWQLRALSSWWVDREPRLPLLVHTGEVLGSRRMKVALTTFSSELPAAESIAETF